MLKDLQLYLTYIYSFVIEYLPAHPQAKDPIYKAKIKYLTLDVCIFIAMNIKVVFLFNIDVFLGRRTYEKNEKTAIDS